MSTFFASITSRQLGIRRLVPSFIMKGASYNKDCPILMEDVDYIRKTPEKSCDYSTKTMQFLKGIILMELVLALGFLCFLLLLSTPTFESPREQVEKIDKIQQPQLVDDSIKLMKELDPNDEENLEENVINIRQEISIPVKGFVDLIQMVMTQRQDKNSVFPELLQKILVKKQEETEQLLDMFKSDYGTKENAWPSTDFGNTEDQSLQQVFVSETPEQVSAWDSGNSEKIYDGGVFQDGADFKDVSVFSELDSDNVKSQESTSTINSPVENSSENWGSMLSGGGGHENFDDFSRDFDRISEEFDTFNSKKARKGDLFKSFF